MSKATKRKHVVQEILDDFSLPKEGDQIVKVVCSKGNNLHQVMTAGGELFLVSMPTKFRKNVWIKRGDYVIVEPIDEGDKVKAEIVSILYKDRIKYIKEEGQWPQAFDKKTVMSDVYIPEDLLPPSDDSGDEDIAPMVVNSNRVQPEYQEESDESEEEKEEEKES
ncbi:hypothetical protein CHS0354_021601 [Potamilus streckersoni]|uniref:Probable RNA-binding protein EIF1AD n=1 Tax=Potamilus streckersoni TaxID=2493646 RepID=A0AAE0W015_9BIVA|nr:hypothetical protein CHS0354_021601 [Potamilus streckersoni]